MSYLLLLNYVKSKLVHDEQFDFSNYLYHQVY